MNKVIVASLLILISTFLSNNIFASNVYDYYYNNKESLNSYRGNYALESYIENQGSISYSNNILVGRLKFYIKMDKKSSYPYLEISHFCQAYFESGKKNFSILIGKLGLFAVDIKNDEKLLIIKRVSCKLEDKEIKFLDFNLAITDINYTRINYFGDLSVFVNNQIKPRKTLSVCNSNRFCQNVVIIYPEKIARFYNLDKAREDIGNIPAINLINKEISVVKLSHDNPEMPKIIEEKNNLPF